MLVINAHSANELYSKCAVELALNSSVAKGRQQGNVHEIRDVALVLENPNANVISLPFRNPSRKYMAGEYALYTKATDDVEDFAYYSSTWRKLATNGKVNSAYGARIFSTGKWEFVLDQLVANRDSKNAVIDMREPSDLLPEQPDRCCTLSLVFAIRDNALTLTVDMRSSDFWLGLPYDLFCFTMFQKRMVYEYNKRTHSRVQLGTYTHICHSLHVYEKHFARVTNYVNERPRIDWFKAYEFPTYDHFAEDETKAFLEWEEKFRKNGASEELANELRDAKFHPYWETLGAWLITPITMARHTEMDLEMFAKCDEAATDSKCIDRKVGCVIASIQDGEVQDFITGCNEVIECNQNCSDKQHRVCNVCHAEVSTLAKFQSKFANIKPTTAWVNLFPCLPCRKALNAAGVTDIRVLGRVHKGAYGETEVKVYDTETLN